VTIQVAGTSGGRLPTPVTLNPAADAAARRAEANAVGQRLLDSHAWELSGLEAGRAMSRFGRNRDLMDATLRARLDKLMNGSRGTALRDQAAHMEAEAHKLRSRADHIDGESATTLASPAPSPGAGINPAIAREMLKTPDKYSAGVLEVLRAAAGRKAA